MQFWSLESFLKKSNEHACTRRSTEECIAFSLETIYIINILSIWKFWTKWSVLFLLEVSLRYHWRNAHSKDSNWTISLIITTRYRLLWQGWKQCGCIMHSINYRSIGYTRCEWLWDRLLLRVRMSYSMLSFVINQVKLFGSLNCIT
jgi:hypothetical protein